MSAEPPTPIQSCLNRLAAGDPSARADLFRLSRDRLHAMTRATMTRFPRLRRWVESDDVLQNALLRLDRTLEKMPVESVRVFLAAAGLNIRRELLDLVRHYFGEHGAGTRHGTPPAAGPRPEEAAGTDRDDPSLVAQWAEMHEQVDGLPADEREVFVLRVYQGMTVAEVAGAINTSERTVKRRWARARVWLANRLGQELPAGVGDE